MNTSRLIAWFGRRGIYYGWVIVAVMFVTLFISLGFRFAFGGFYSAILDETGWVAPDKAAAGTGHGRRREGELVSRSGPS